MSLDNSVKQTQIHSIRYRSCVAVFQLLHVIAQVFVRGNVRAEKPYCVYAPPPLPYPLDVSQYNAWNLYTSTGRASGPWRLLLISLSLNIDNDFSLL